MTRIIIAGGFLPLPLLLVLLLLLSLGTTTTTAFAAFTMSPPKREDVYPAIQTPTGISSSDSIDNDFYTYGVLNYVDPSVEVAHVRRAPNGNDLPYEAVWDPKQVKVHNARTTATPCTLDRDGCELQASPLFCLDKLNFLDSAAVVQYYYPACEALLKQRLLGSINVQVTAFDHNIRMAAGNATTANGVVLQNAGPSTVQVPLGLVHGDYTAVSAPRRLQQLAQATPKQNDVWRCRRDGGDGGDQSSSSLLDPDVVAAAVAGKRRFALINVWRSIDVHHPVTSYPLAFCRAPSVVPQAALRTLQIHYTDRIGENYLAAHEASHQWCYYPHMMANEVLLIKQWDSAGAWATQQTDGKGDSLSTFALHSAFGLPEGAEAIPRPRKSIEVRCVCMWDEEEGNEQQQPKTQKHD